MGNSTFFFLFLFFCCSLQNSLILANSEIRRGPSDQSIQCTSSSQPKYHEMTRNRLRNPDNVMPGDRGPFLPEEVPWTFMRRNS